MRVHELAKELGVTSKELLATLEQMGVAGKSASSSVPEDLVPRLRASGGKATEAPKRREVLEPPPAPRKPKPKPKLERVEAKAPMPKPSPNRPFTLAAVQEEIGQKVLPDGSIQGYAVEGEPGIRESVAEIMLRERATPDKREIEAVERPIHANPRLCRKSRHLDSAHHATALQFPATFFVTDLQSPGNATLQ